jgi:hypothetical protein
MNTRHEILHPLIVLGLFAFAPSFASAAVPAFPGAQGGGAVSVGGRGGQVIEVTNLNDSGAGSLRACVQASGPRTCVFRVGGTINLLSALRIKNPFLTIAGQTAPGGGILLRGTSIGDEMIILNNTNMVIRYLRIRKGFSTPCSNGATSDCGTNIVLGADAGTTIIDHVSSSWNQDESFGTSIGTNVTFSYNLSAEGLSSHSTGISAGGSTPAISARMTNIDLHHNLSMSNSHRNPILRVKSSRVVNNLWYNQRWWVTRTAGGISADIIGNKYKRGPLNPTNGLHEVGILGVESRSVTGLPSVYLSGNVGWKQTNPAGDQWLMAATVLNAVNGGEGGPIVASWRRAAPMANTTYPIIAEPVGNIEASILPTVGASRRLDCNGNWVANRDAVDTRLIKQYQTNTGSTSLISHESQAGGFPAIAGGTACTDTDHDGMPDVWETARGLNPNNAADRNAVAASGYTNLEVYLAGTGATTTPPPSGDTTPPTVSITAPVNGSTVSGSAVTVSANASDNVGVASVDFKVDGTTLFTDTTSPYATIWDTATAANGPHTLTALARDAAGNVTSSSGVSVTVNTPPPGLVGAYKFEEASGSTVVDASGKGNTGTISGATRITQGRFGKALSFDGVNDWVTVNDAPSLDLTTGMTLEAWVYPTVDMTRYSTVMLKEQPGGALYELVANGDQSQPLTTVKVGGGYGVLSGGPWLLANQWTHLAATYDGTIQRLYVDGTQVAQRPQTGPIPVSSSPLRLGGNSVWGEFFQGRIDEVRVYNHALNATDIQTDMSRR